MKKIIIALSFICVSSIILIQYIKYKDDKKLLYNNKVLKQTLNQQIKYVTKNKKCPKEVQQTYNNLIKHLLINETILKNRQLKYDKFKKNNFVDSICNN